MEREIAFYLINYVKYFQNSMCDVFRRQIRINNAESSLCRFALYRTGGRNIVDLNRTPGTSFVVVRKLIFTSMERGIEEGYLVNYTRNISKIQRLVFYDESRVDNVEFPSFFVYRIEGRIVV